MKFVCSIIVFLLSFACCKAQDEDLLPELRLFEKVYAKYALDEQPNVVADTNLIAIWKMQEDVSPHNYFVLERYDYNSFVFTYMNREGSNRTYENVTAFFSKIGNTDFLNVSYPNRKTGGAGFFFLKVTDRDSRGWDMTLSLVTDTTLKDITSSKALRERIAKNVNNSAFFGKPVHFRKKLPLMFCK